MQIADIKGKKWAIELDWEVLPGNKNVKTESKEIALSSKCSYGVLVNQGISDNQMSGQGGKWVAIGLAKKAAKYPSAAVSLALANDAEKNSSSEFDYKPDWIVIEEMPDERFWMVVISRSVPLPQTDVIVDKTTLVDKINNLLINDVFKIYSTSEDIRLIYEGQKEIIPKGLNELTEDIHSKVNFKKFTGIPTNIVYAGLGIMILAASALGVQTYLESSIAKKQREEVALRAAQEQEAKRIAYEQQIKAYDLEYERLKQEQINGVVQKLAGDPNKIINSMYEAVGELVLGLNGWKTNTIDCAFDPSSERKIVCLFSFERTGLTTNRMLLQDYPDAVIEGDKANVTRSILGEPDAYKLPPLSVLDTLPTAKTWGFDMVSQLQLLKIVDVDHKITGSTEIFFNPPAKPLSEQEKASGQVEQVPPPVSIGISSGQIELESENFVILREVSDNIDFKSVGVSSISFNFSSPGTIKWKVLMNYFVRNGQGVIATSDSAALPATNVNVEKPELSQAGMPMASAPTTGLPTTPWQGR